MQLCSCLVLNMVALSEGAVVRPVLPSRRNFERLRGGSVTHVKLYLELCSMYGVKPNPSILVALRWDLPDLVVARGSGAKFRDHDLLPLCDLLLLPSVAHVRSLSLPAKKGCRLRAGGALQIARLISRCPNLESVDLTGNKLGPEGGVALADTFGQTRSLREMRLRGCRVGAAGADAFALRLAAGTREDGATALKLLDLSNNRIGFVSKMGIERVNQHRTKPIRLELTGNLVLLEVLNVVTHGSGALAAVLGSAYLLRSVQHASSTIRMACAVYAASLCLVYLSSTVFHSAFTLGRIRHILHIFDQCAIYMLIAGSYTPFMVALFHPSKPAWSVHLLAYLWACAAAGCFAEIAFHKARLVAAPWLKFTSLTVYVMMGWAAALPPLLRDIRAAMEPKALGLLVAGGLAYTLGVPAFVRNRHLDHAIWHVFVLAGSVCHFLSLKLTLASAMRGTI